MQRREDRGTEDRAVVAACTPKPGGRPRCCRTVVASYQNPAARQGKRSGALWPQAPAPHDPGCARRPPRPLLVPLPRRGCGSLRRASKGSATAQEGSRSCFSALGTEGDGGRGTASSLRLRWCRPSQLSSEGRCGSGCSLQDLGAPPRWVPGLPANPRVSFLLQNTRAWFPVLTSLLLAEVSRAMLGCDLGQREEGRPGSLCLGAGLKILLQARTPP